MLSVTLEKFGGPEVLKLVDAPTPQPGPGEVLIRVAAAGINRADIHQRQGNYPPPAGASEILGLEVAGEIVACGPQADSRWRIGDQVCALVPGGGYAEFCVAHSACLLPVPGSITLEEAASLPEAVMTVWANLFAVTPRSNGRLFAGESFLMQGGTSGIGVIAIQIALARGARVVATAGSAEKCRFLRQLGCEEAWNYRDQDWIQGARAWTGQRGVDVILDMVGGDYFPRHLDLLAKDGRLIHIAFSHGAEVQLNLRKVMGKRLTITGSTLRSRPPEEKRSLRDAVEEHIWPLIADRQVHPVVDRVFPLRDVAAAHRRMESSEHIGKLVLRVESAAR